MTSSQEIIKKTRQFMKNEKINYLIVFSTDEYLNEYIDLKENSRYILTGFSGSTGDALVTPENIFLFVDGRYHLQAEEETDKNLVTVVKVGIEKSPQKALYEKIAELSEGTIKIGIISNKINCGSYRKLLDELVEKDVIYKEFDFDPVLKIAGIEKRKNINPLRLVSKEISELSTEEKLDLVVKYNKKNNLDSLIITKLEEIAYLTNLRGKEIPYSSTFKAKLIVHYDKCYIFTDLNRIPQEILQTFGERFIFDEEEVCFKIIDLWEKIPTSINIGYDFNSMTLSRCRYIEKLKHKLVDVKESPVSLMKSIKNTCELKHMRECFLKTDIVVNRAICWLRQGLEYGQKISEKDFSAKVKALFFEEGAVDLSFETIAACGRNTAFIHYTKANPEKFIQPGDIVLLDCGAYFEGGYATDITRTFLAGGKKASADKKQKEIYTGVLKAFLHGINFELDENTTGFDIDKKVREIIEQNKPEGFNFGHGTGHGIGISVHESPPRLGPSEISKTKLQAGMCFTIEPGLYCDDWGGVRIENTVEIIEINGKLKIKSLTKASLDDNLIEETLLTEQEKNWLNNYQYQAIK